jgi:hypothetical protein
MGTVGGRREDERPATDPDEILAGDTGAPAILPRG